jgi:hypothetical protein
MQQVGIQCYHCHAGVFMHRKFWRFTYIDGDMIATPKDEVTDADLMNN